MRRTKNVMCIKECQALVNAKQVAKEFNHDNEKQRYETLYNNETKPLEAQARPPKYFISPMKAAIGMNYDDFQDKPRQAKTSQDKTVIFKGRLQTMLWNK